ncbi:MAG: hypothetical protein K0S61_4333 [Anaerocolumna sp.]|jgi:hypothetical protein|nr:hypothetical protein [Anaerocolumna sp.]
MRISHCTDHLPDTLTVIPTTKDQALHRRHCRRLWLGSGLEIDLNNASDKQLESVLARYNGTGSAVVEYGNETKQYYDVFNQFNK